MINKTSAIKTKVRFVTNLCTFEGNFWINKQLEPNYDYQIECDGQSPFEHSMCCVFDERKRKCAIVIDDGNRYTADENNQ